MVDVRSYSVNRVASYTGPGTEQLMGSGVQRGRFARLYANDALRSAACRQNGLLTPTPDGVCCSYGE